MSSPLPSDDIERRLKDLPGWERRGNAIRREYAFGDFREAMAFVNRVAELAERADHHPDIDIRYDRVTLTLTTHSAGGLTARDLQLAAQADGVSGA